MDSYLLIGVIASAVVSGTPILFAALGELLTQRSGIMNLGVEGMMLVGAVIGFIVTTMTGNAWLGFGAGMLAGGGLAFLHAVITVSLGGNQVVSGLALTIFGTGLSGFLGKSYQGLPPTARFMAVPIPGLSDIPVLGRIFFQQDMLVYLSFILILGLWWVLYKTTVGLKIRAVGQNPAAADSAGISVALTRYICTVAGGMMAGMGGAYLSLASAPSWQENMTVGRGWIAVALVIFALWDPLRALLGSYLFGGLQILNYSIQIMGFKVSPFFLQMLPYLLTILVLALVTIRKGSDAREPQALGVPYYREER